MEKEKRKILICDDESVLRASYELIFSENYDILFAGNGEEALICLENDLPDLIILDIKMPKLDGIDALKIIHQNWPKIPTIVVTGYNCVETATQAIKWGAKEYLPKPFHRDDIKKLVDKWLNPTIS